MASKTATIKAVVLGDVDNFKKGMTEAGQAAEETGGKVSRDLGGGFDKLGDAGGSAEQKFIGLKDSITGTQDVMEGLRTGNVTTLAMGLADLGGAVENLWSSVGKTITTWWGKVTATTADTAATTANTGATIGQRIATTATTIATKAHAAAQWLLNTALSANPIMIVVVALAALVAGFIIAYKNVGWFRDIVDAVARFFTDTLWPVLQDVGGWIGGVFVAMWDAAKVAVGWVIDQGQALYDLVATYVFPVLQTVAGWIGTYFVTQFNLAKDVVGFLLDVFGWVVDKVNQYVLPVLQTLAGWVGGALVTQFGLARDAVGWIIDKLQAVWNKAIEVKDGITGAFDTVVGFVGGLAGRIATAADGMWDGIKDAFRGAINWIIGKWNDLSFSLPSFEVLGQKTPGFTLSTPNIPMLAQGGLIRGGRGGTLAMIGEGRSDELVVPLDRAGRGGGLGTTINVTVVAPVGASSRDIGRELQRHLNEYARAS